MVRCGAVWSLSCLLNLNLHKLYMQSDNLMVFSFSFNLTFISDFFSALVCFANSLPKIQVNRFIFKQKNYLIKTCNDFLKKSGTHLNWKLNSLNLISLKHSQFLSKVALCIKKVATLFTNQQPPLFNVIRRRKKKQILKKRKSM